VKTSACAALLIPLVLAGCQAWATKGQHQFKLVAPDTVAAGAEYVFTVEVTDAAGQPARNVTFGWLIDWPTVRGISHTGTSFEPQRMVVKGNPGKAQLRLYMKDESGRTTQVDKVDFTVR
jgi:hypothetical protein